MKNGKETIRSILVSSSVISEGYTGQVIFHFGEGNICDVECVVTRKKSLGPLLNKKVLDISVEYAKKEGNNGK